MLGVIILNWNGRKLLEQFLPTAVRFTQGSDVELVVADNGSTDDSVEWIRSRFPNVRVLEFKENLGFAGGYNKAINETDYEYVILLNSDVEVTDGWWQPLLAFMKRHPEVGACQPKIRSYHKRDYFEYAGAAGGYLDRLGYPYCRGRILEKVERDEGQYDGDPVEITWASGAALMVRVSAYREAGGLDERFFAHQEEIDLCCRMIALGYKVMALSDSVVYHVGGASLNQGNPKKTYLNFRNNLLLLHKNLPTGKGRRVLFVRRLADTLAWGMYVVTGDWKNAGAVWRAHRDFRSMRNLYAPASEDRLPLERKLIMLSKLGL
ncbi:MAG: glycosyltransferase family 2 protein [Muribaculaceae bacterium]|nr:glycosyltransferase family 2 protein [Muribaculaceae bacterium]